MKDDKQFIFNVLINDYKDIQEQYEKTNILFLKFRKRTEILLKSDNPFGRVLCIEFLLGNIEVIIKNNTNEIIKRIDIIPNKLWSIVLEKELKNLDINIEIYSKI